ncbi:MAG: CRISPR-associated protein Cas2 [Spirochaetaceae bacterium]|nr:CRISPR-associated protein Cas2 [Spirochaetaceae bacterium]MDT8298108.1 CRISPR-associated protein Cas2 [Spirochaetaceae bacterium]
MFVSVVLDLGNEDSLKAVTGLLFRYGFRQMQKNAFESTAVDEKRLSRLKVEMDRATDFYDSIRFYQYPVDGTVAITSLSEKRWRRVIIREKE